MLHGIVKIPATDIWARADANSERMTQALFGTPVEIRNVGKKFSKVALTDGITGWCRTSHVHHVGFAAWNKYRKRPKAKVKANTAKVTGLTGNQKSPFLLFLGTELIISDTDSKKSFLLPDGTTANIRQNALQMPVARRTRGVTPHQLVRVAKKFLGAPYLWGGITPYGLDCSGLVQTVFAFFDIRLARNSGDQRKKGFEIARENVRAGDLLFFPGHVVMATGKSWFIHASASRGMVIIETFDRKSPIYREDLDRGFICARRIPL